MHLIHSNGIVLYYFLYLVLFFKETTEKTIHFLKEEGQEHNPSEG